VFKQFKQNPEHFISEASRLINEQKAAIIIERPSCVGIAETHDIGIFTARRSKQDFTKASGKPGKRIYDSVVTDSNV
jgi:type III restriction enzyme